MIISDFGPIKAASFPDTWTEEQEENDGGLGGRRCITLHPPDDDFSITLFYRGLPLDPASAGICRRLLGDMSNLAELRELGVEEIQHLTMVLGVSTVGDNQFSNPSSPDSEYAPAFQLVSAELVAIADCRLLSVYGHFSSQTHYHGYFVPSSDDCRSVYEIFLQTKNMEKFPEYDESFQRIVEAIEFSRD